MSRRVAFCWELGGGLGHFSLLSPLIEYFRRKDFQISFIVRDVWSAGRWFEAGKIELLQAPFRHGAGLQYTSTPTFAHVLFNVGYGDPEGLVALASAWKSLLDLVRPDVVIADHSPTAILAARALRLPTLVSTSGFGCPPDESPMPDVEPWLKTDPIQLVTVETQVLDSINSVLERWNQTTLRRVSQLYHDGPSPLLLTFEELDHFPSRNGAEYFGCWPYQEGERIDWPMESGRKIFAYLKRSPHLPKLLSMLSRNGHRVIAYLGADPDDLQRQFERSQLKICRGIADLRDAGRTSDLAITNGNLGTTTAMLLAGTPVLCLPMHLEQLLIGKAVERLGAGAAVAPENVGICEKAIHAISSQSKYRESAEAFANRYAGFSLESYRQRIEGELDSRLRHLG